MNISVLLRIEPLLDDIKRLSSRAIDVAVLLKYIEENGIAFNDSKSLVDALDESFLHQFPLILQEISLEESLIPTEVPVQIQKKRYRVNGEIWEIHKSDVDPFPSSPHAHNYDKNLSLHLGNGRLYRKRNFVGMAKRKEFLALRDRVTCVELPPLEK